MSVSGRSVKWVVFSTGGVASPFSGSVAHVSGGEDGMSESDASVGIDGCIGGSALSATSTRERRASVRGFFIRLGCFGGTASVAALEGTTGQTVIAVAPGGGGGKRISIRGGRPFLQQVEAQSMHFRFAAQHSQRDCGAEEHLLVA